MKQFTISDKLFERGYSVISPQESLVTTCELPEYDAQLLADTLNSLQQIIHLHSCEQEGISSGQPTPKQWLEAYDKGVKVLQEAKGF